MYKYRSILDDLLCTSQYSAPFNLYDSTSALALGRYSVESDESSFELQISLPGHDNSSVKVSIEDGRLAISTQVDPKKSTRLAQSESFRFKLPKDCNLNEVDAQMANGILTVQISKEVKQQNSRKIEITVN
jgi:HSP20 family molecular chaperone IbpA